MLTTLSFGDLLAAHRDAGALATMAVKERSVDVQYGVVHTDADGRIERLEEKPRLRFTVSMGIYAMEPAIIDLIGDGERVDFPDLLLRAMRARPRGPHVRARRLLARHRQPRRLRGGDRRLHRRARALSAGEASGDDAG